jgi:quercetin dioxygenase-like cupin family protein
VTAGRYGLFEYAMGPRSAGPGPHYHRTLSESFYVLSGELTILADGTWSAFGPGDLAHVPEDGVHGFRNDGDAAASFLILFAPGIAGSGSSSSSRRCASRGWSSPPRNGWPSTPATTR